MVYLYVFLSLMTAYSVEMLLMYLVNVDFNPANVFIFYACFVHVFVSENAKADIS